VQEEYTTTRLHIIQLVAANKHAGHATVAAILQSMAANWRNAVERAAIDECRPSSLTKHASHYLLGKREMQAIVVLGNENRLTTEHLTARRHSSDTHATNSNQQPTNASNTTFAKLTTFATRGL
jgi:hypothetical protein